jgi:hypothetical protein
MHRLRERRIHQDNLELIAAHAVSDPDQPSLEIPNGAVLPKPARTSRLSADRFAGAGCEHTLKSSLLQSPQSFEAVS